MGSSTVPSSATTATRVGLTSERVWKEVSKASFAVVSHVTPAGEPRSSGVVLVEKGKHLYVVTARQSLKARQIRDGESVAVTVPIRRGGLLSLVAPIPPATVTFMARAVLHPRGLSEIPQASERLARRVPKQRLSGIVIELVPEGAFRTFGVGVSLLAMMDPDKAEARVPIG